MIVLEALIQEYPNVFATFPRVTREQLANLPRQRWLAERARLEKTPSYERTIEMQQHIADLTIKLECTSEPWDMPEYNIELSQVQKETATRIHLWARYHAKALQYETEPLLFFMEADPGDSLQFAGLLLYLLSMEHLMPRRIILDSGLLHRYFLLNMGSIENVIAVYHNLSVITPTLPSNIAAPLTELLTLASTTKCVHPTRELTRGFEAYCLNGIVSTGEPLEFNMSQFIYTLSPHNIQSLSLYYGYEPLITMLQFAQAQNIHTRLLRDSFAHCIQNTTIPALRNLYYLIQQQISEEDRVPIIIFLGRLLNDQQIAALLDEPMLAWMILVSKPDLLNTLGVSRITMLINMLTCTPTPNQPFVMELINELTPSTWQYASLLYNDGFFSPIYQNLYFRRLFDMLVAEPTLLHSIGPELITSLQDYEETDTWAREGVLQCKQILSQAMEDFRGTPEHPFDHTNYQRILQIYHAQKLVVDLLCDLGAEHLYPTDEYELQSHLIERFFTQDGSFNLASYLTSFHDDATTVDIESHKRRTMFLCLSITNNHDLKICLKTALEASQTGQNTVLHWVASGNEQEFQAVSKLYPADVCKNMLLQQNEQKENPLYIAAATQNPQLLLAMLSLLQRYETPWDDILTGLKNITLSNHNVLSHVIYYTKKFLVSLIQICPKNNRFDLLTEKNATGKPYFEKLLYAILFEPTFLNSIDLPIDDFFLDENQKNKLLDTPFLAWKILTLNPLLMHQFNEQQWLKCLAIFEDDGLSAPQLTSARRAHDQTTFAEQVFKLFLADTINKNSPLYTFLISRAQMAEWVHKAAQTHGMQFNNLITSLHISSDRFSRTMYEPILAAYLDSHVLMNRLIDTPFGKDISYPVNIDALHFQILSASFMRDPMIDIASYLDVFHPEGELAHKQLTLYHCLALITIDNIGRYDQYMTLSHLINALKLALDAYQQDGNTVLHWLVMQEVHPVPILKHYRIEDCLTMLAQHNHQDQSIWQLALRHSLYRLASIIEHIPEIHWEHVYQGITHKKSGEDRVLDLVAKDPEALAILTYACPQSKRFELLMEKDSLGQPFFYTIMLVPDNLRRLNLFDPSSPFFAQSSPFSNEEKFSQLINYPSIAWAILACTPALFHTLNTTMLISLIKADESCAKEHCNSPDLNHEVLLHQHLRTLYLNDIHDEHAWISEVLRNKVHSHEWLIHEEHQLLQTYDNMLYFLGSADYPFSRETYEHLMQTYRQGKLIQDKINRVISAHGQYVVKVYPKSPLQFQARIIQSLHRNGQSEMQTWISVMYPDDTEVTARAYSLGFSDTIIHWAAINDDPRQLYEIMANYPQPKRLAQLLHLNHQGLNALHLAAHNCPENVLLMLRMVGSITGQYFLYQNRYISSRDLPKEEYHALLNKIFIQFSTPDQTEGNTIWHLLAQNASENCFDAILATFQPHYYIQALCIKNSSNHTVLHHLTQKTSLDLRQQYFEGAPVEDLIRLLLQDLPATVSHLDLSEHHRHTIAAIFSYIPPTVQWITFTPYSAKTFFMPAQKMSRQNIEAWLQNNLRQQTDSVCPPHASTTEEAYSIPLANEKTGFY